MQRLDILNAPPRSDSRLKSLFWPSIRHATDIDYLGQQGFWVCVLIGVAMLLGTGLPAGVFHLLFYFLGGMGVRERSRVAAIGVFVGHLLMTIAYLVVMPLASLNVARVIFLALLLANVRATWISSRLLSDSGEILPPRLGKTLGDKVVDRLPQILWPRLRWLFYVLLGVLILGVLLVLVALLFGQRIPVMGPPASRAGVTVVDGPSTQVSSSIRRCRGSS